MKFGTVNAPQTFIAWLRVAWKAGQKRRHFSYDRKRSYICASTVKMYDILEVTHVWVRSVYSEREGPVCSVADCSKCLDICWHNLFFEKPVLTFEDSSFFNTLIDIVSDWVGIYELGRNVEERFLDYFKTVPWHAHEATEWKSEISKFVKIPASSPDFQTRVSDFKLFIPYVIYN
jgi:hypothetical protein